MNASQYIAKFQEEINKTGNPDTLPELYAYHLYIFRGVHGGNKSDFDKAWQQALRIRENYQEKLKGK